MAQKKPDLIDWLGLRRLSDIFKARWLGGLVSVAVIILLVLFLGGAIVAFLKAVFGGDPQGVTLRNTGLVLAALLGAPFLVWRSVVAQKQVDVAEQGLFNDKINAAADDLHARRLVTLNPDKTDNRWDYWQDDIVRRNVAIDRLGGLAAEQPETAPRIARMLGIYVRELTRENPPQTAPEEATPDELRDWAGGLQKYRRSDMENAVQTLGRLQAIDGVAPDAVKIDLRGVNLQGFDLHGASLENARLEGAQMQGADLGWAQMQGANLMGVQMQGADLNGAQMQGANLSLAQMQGVNLSWAEMQGAILSDAQMQGADLGWAEMQGAVLRAVQMQGAVLSGAQMQGANLSGAQLDSATSLTGAMLQGASAREVEYSDVRISQAQVDSLFYDGSVTFPEHLDWERDRPKIEDWSEFDTKWREWQESIGFDLEKYGA